MLTIKIYVLKDLCGSQHVETFIFSVHVTGMFFIGTFVFLNLFFFIIRFRIKFI